MQPTVAYESKQAILEEAGFAFVVLSESLGTGDGSTETFTTTHKPIIDSNYDDSLDATDVTVYVNGTPVSVATVSGMTGAITLKSAPGNGTAVTADYVWSPIKDGYTTKARNEAQDHINEIMSTLESTPYANFSDDTPTPSTITRICRYFAAALILMRDYGAGFESTNTSKDGDGKWKTAEGWLENYLEQGGFTGGNTNPFADADVKKQRNPFRTRRDRDFDGSLTPTDDAFMFGGDDGLGGGDDDDWL